MEQDRPYAPETEQDATTRILTKLHELDLSFQKIGENLTEQIEDNRRRIQNLELELERMQGDLRAAGRFIT